MNVKFSKSRSYRKQEITLLSIIVFLFIIFSFATDNFFTFYNITNLFKQASIAGILAISATIVIISKGIDLSVGAVTGLSAFITAMFIAKLGLPIWLTIAAAIAIGLIAGIFNGVIIHEFRLPPFIATLGTMTIIRGIIKSASGGKTIAGLPVKFTQFSKGLLFGFIPNLTIVWIFIILITFFILKYTRFGRNIYVIGCGDEVAKLCGINIRINRYAIYAFAGLLSGIAGVLLTSRINSAVPTGGQGYELLAIAAAVVGGASMFGGQGGVLGTVQGTFLLILIDNGGIHFGIDPFIMEILSGVIIIVAVVLDQFRQKNM